MILHRKKNIKFLFFIFLLLHTVPLINRELYKFITFLNYSTILPLILLTSSQKKKTDLFSIYFLLLIIASFFLFFLGYSGTISALVLGATVPFFLFKNISNEEDFISMLYTPIIISSSILLLSGFYLFFQVRNQLTDYYFLGEYFVIASINYVSLVFFSFSVLAYIIITLKINKETNKKIKSFNFFFLLVILLSGVYFSYCYLTRSTLITSLCLLGLHLKKYWILFIPAIFLYLIIDGVLINMLFDFMGGSDINKIVKHGKREKSIILLIENSINLNFNFREYMSYSSIVNLVFSIFPFTLIYLYYILNSLKAFSLKKINLIILFSLCLIITIYQMDFLTIFSFFFVIEFIKFKK